MASLFLDWLKARDRENICKLGCCIGFAILSKGSAYVTAFPFVLAIAFFCLRSPRKLLLQGIAAAAIIIALNAPHLARTYQAYGSIVGGTERNILYHPTPGTLAVNIVYNFLLHEPWLLKGPLLGFWQGLPAAITLSGIDSNFLRKSLLPIHFCHTHHSIHCVRKSVKSSLTCFLCFPFTNRLAAYGLFAALSSS
jgi:4-amino-4-deoxy-L-arabinose transferase-like glycosyltransferase